MRALLLLLALAILVAIVLVFTGVLSLHQTQPAQAPKFDLSVKPVDIGTTTKNVQVPAVEMQTKQVEVPKISVGDGNQASGQ